MLSLRKSRFLLFFMDFFGAFFPVWFLFLKDNVLEPNALVWCVTFLFAWGLSFESRRYFVPDSYFRAGKVALYSLALSFCILVVMCQPYSLGYFLMLIMVWWFWAMVWRWMMRCVTRPVRILLAPGVFPILKVRRKVDWIQLTQLDERALNAIDYIMIDPNNHAYDSEWQTFFLEAETSGIPVMSDIQLHECLLSKVPLNALGEGWLDNAVQINRLYVILKRLMDIVVSVLFSPLLIFLCLLIAGFVRFSMGRNVIFSQERIGEGGRCFRIYKFRTMVRNASRRGETNSKSDIRITPLGRYLRRFRLDELPQFWNVFRGDMSLIGPRPEWRITAQEFEQSIPFYKMRYLVKPGISGWAQVNQGYATGIEGNMEKLQYDIFYVRNFSFWLDVRIACRTVWTLLAGKGAR